MSLIFMVYVNELSLERGSTRRERVRVEERTYAWHQGIMGDSLSWWITMHVQESRCLASKQSFATSRFFFFNGIGQATNQFVPLFPHLKILRIALPS